MSLISGCLLAIFCCGKFPCLKRTVEGARWTGKGLAGGVIFVPSTAFSVVDGGDALDGGVSYRAGVRLLVLDASEASSEKDKYSSDAELECFDFEHNSCGFPAANTVS